MSYLIELLCGATGMGPSELRRLLESAPERYKEFQIPKRKKGYRTIAQPAREIKFLQRIFMREFLEGLPVHEAATAYRKGLTLAANVEPHAGSGRPILKMDFKDFFPSIRSRDWASYCRKTGILGSSDDIWLSERLLFYRPPGGRVLRLSVGAPTSPIVSNILMWDIDQKISAVVAKDRVVYTRYADDLTFSAERTGFLVKVKRDVAKIIRETQFPKLAIRGDKTKYATSKYHREITGLILSNDGRVTIGRDQKRNLYAKIHHFLSGTLDDSDTVRLAGMISFIRSVEPDFLSAIDRKYGEGSVALVLARSQQLHNSGKAHLRSS